MLLACLHISWAVKPEGACFKKKKCPSCILPSSRSTERVPQASVGLNETPGSWPGRREGEMWQDSYRCEWG